MCSILIFGIRQFSLKVNINFWYFPRIFNTLIEPVTFKREHVCECKFHRRAKKQKNWLIETFFLKTERLISQVLYSPLYI